MRAYLAAILLACLVLSDTGADARWDQMLGKRFLPPSIKSHKPSTSKKAASLNVDMCRLHTPDMCMFCNAADFTSKKTDNREEMARLRKMYNIPGLKELAFANPDTRSCTHLAISCKRDGLGAQMQARISIWMIARMTGIQYVHTPYSHLAHNKGDDASVGPAYERFFNLGDGEMTFADAEREGATVCGARYCFQSFDEDTRCWVPMLSELRSKYYSSPKPAPFSDPKKLIVAMHVRLGDVKPKKGDPIVKDTKSRSIPIEYYTEAVTRIKSALSPSLLELLEVRVLSEGNPSDFQDLTAAHPNVVKLHLDGDVMVTLHTMVTADILVMAHSSFSFTAALYNSGFVVYSDFWHKPLPHWIINGPSTSTLVNALSSNATHTNLHNRILNRSGWVKNKG